MSERETHSNLDADLQRCTTPVYGREPDARRDGSRRAACLLDTCGVPWTCSTTTTAVVLAVIPKPIRVTRQYPSVPPRGLPSNLDARETQARKSTCSGPGTPQSLPHGWLLLLRFSKLRRAAVFRPVCGARGPPVTPAATEFAGLARMLAIHGAMEVERALRTWTYT